MDLSRPSIKLCVLGTQAEFERRINDARILFREAWDCATDEYEKCVAAHYVAHLEDIPSEALRWNLAALSHAQLANADLVSSFLPSLYVNIGYSYELLGDQIKSVQYYGLASELGLTHQTQLARERTNLPRLC